MVTRKAARCPTSWLSRRRRPPPRKPPPPMTRRCPAKTPPQRLPRLSQSPPSEETDTAKAPPKEDTPTPAPAIEEAATDTAPVEDATTDPMRAAFTPEDLAAGEAAAKACASCHQFEREDPKAYAPGTKMNFVVRDAEERRQIAGWLASVTE